MESSSQPTLPGGKKNRSKSRKRVKYIVPGSKHDTVTSRLPDIPKNPFVPLHHQFPYEPRNLFVTFHVDQDPSVHTNKEVLTRTVSLHHVERPTRFYPKPKASLHQLPITKWNYAQRFMIAQAVYGENEISMPLETVPAPVPKSRKKEKKVASESKKTAELQKVANHCKKPADLSESSTARKKHVNLSNMTLNEKFDFLFGSPPRNKSNNLLAEDLRLTDSDTD